MCVIIVVCAAWRQTVMWWFLWRSDIGILGEVTARGCAALGFDWNSPDPWPMSAMITWCNNTHSKDTLRGCLNSTSFTVPGKAPTKCVFYQQVAWSATIIGCIICGSVSRLISDHSTRSWTTHCQDSSARIRIVIYLPRTNHRYFYGQTHFYLWSKIFSLKLIEWDCAAWLRGVG